MNEHISGLNIPTTLLLSLLTKFWIDVCVCGLGISRPWCSHLWNGWVGWNQPCPPQYPQQLTVGIPHVEPFSPTPVHTRIQLLWGKQSPKMICDHKLMDLGTSHLLWLGALQPSMQEQDSFVLFKEADCRASGVNDMIAGIQLFISTDLPTVYGASSKYPALGIQSWIKSPLGACVLVRETRDYKIRLHIKWEDF